MAAIPSFPYPGGKSKLRRWILDHAPRSCGVYLEPFAGRGNVFWMATQEIQASHWWLNDAFTGRWLKLLRSGARGLESVGNGPLTRSLHVAMKSNSGSDLAVILEPALTYAGCGYDVGFFDIGETGLQYKRKVSWCGDVLAGLNVKITESHGPSCWWLLGASDFCYIDPPYMNCPTRAYPDSLDHRLMLLDLVKARKERGFHYIVSMYENSLYREILGSPVAIRNTEITIQRMGQRSDNELRTECLWRSF